MSFTRGTWLPGDPRGFRDHDHRVHSSGHYKAPPPQGEHAGLHRYSRTISKRVVRLTPPQCERIAHAIVHKLTTMDLAWRVLAVGSSHVHLLARVPWREAKATFGRLKQHASHAVRDELPGTIWGEGCLPVRVKDEEHYHAIVRYVLAHRAQGACVVEHPRVVARRAGHAGI